MSDTTGTTPPTLSATLADQLAAKPAPAQARKTKPAPKPEPEPVEALVPVTRDTLAVSSVSLPQSRMDALRADISILVTSGMVAERTACTPAQVKQGGSVYRANLVALLDKHGLSLVPKDK